MPGCTRRDLYATAANSTSITYSVLPAAAGIINSVNRSNELGCFIQRTGNHYSHCDRTMRDNKCQQGSNCKSVDRANHFHGRTGNCMPGCRKFNLYSNGNQQHIYSLLGITCRSRSNRCCQWSYGLGCSLLWYSNNNSNLDRTMHYNNS